MNSPETTGDRQGRASGHFKGGHGRVQEGYRGGVWSAQNPQKSHGEKSEITPLQMTLLTQEKQSHSTQNEQNDLWNGKPVTQVFHDFKTLWLKIKKDLPGTSLFYLSCRQNRGLMEEMAVDELGFTEEANLKAKKAALNNNHGQKNREDRVAGMHIRTTALEQKGNLNG